MGFFDFFKKKPEKEIMVVPSNQEQQRADEIADMARERNKNVFPSKNGLQPGEIVLLSYARFEKSIKSCHPDRIGQIPLL